MQNLLLDPESLEADVYHRQDVRLDSDTLADRRWIETAFRHRRVLMSPTRLKAEVYLLQN